MFMLGLVIRNVLKILYLVYINSFPNSKRYRKEEDYIFGVESLTKLTPKYVISLGSLRGTSYNFILKGGNNCLISIFSFTWIF